MNDNNVKNRIEELTIELIKHNELYYNQDNPSISDKNYDMLYKELENLEKEYPQHILSNSPTKKVGADLSGEGTIKHSIPMLSLENSYNREDVEKFLEKLEKTSGKKTLNFSVEPKMDGAAVSITYAGGKLVLAATRGDGETGEVITENVKTIKSLPNEIEYAGTLVIRGEIFMPKSSFNRLNEERSKAGAALFANPRNAASGSLKLLNSVEAAKRGLDIYIYNTDSPTGNSTHKADQELLKKLGLPVNPLNAFCEDLGSVNKQLDEIESHRFSLPYDIDGAVIKVDDYDIRKQMGATGKYPKWAVAYKYEALQVTTVLRDVIFQVGRTGAVTPVAELEPVLLSGSTISRASLHNEDEINRLGVKIGDTVFIEKGGEIIPKVVKVANSPIDAKAIVFPEGCPECSTKLIKPVGEVRWRCPNFICPARIKGSLIHFAGKDAMFIDGLGETLLNALVDEGRLKTFSDIYTLKEDELATRERMGKKSAEKIVKAIADSRAREFYRILFALGLPHVGINTARILANKFGSLDMLLKATFAELVAIKDIGDKTAELLTTTLKDPALLNILDELKQHGLNFKQEINETPIESKISRLTFLITGTLSRPRKTIEDEIMKKGGVIAGTVSKNLNYLVVGEKAGSKLTKANSLGIHTISEDELNRMLDE